MEKYIVNPAYRLRSDGNRVLIIAKDHLEGKKEYDFEDCISLMHPLNAQMLSFFNGEDDYELILRKISKHFNLSIESTEEIVSRYVENEKHFGICYDGQPMVFPKKLIIRRGSHHDYPVYKVSDFDYSGTVDLNNRRLNIPQTINVELTMKCYTDCIYCYANRRMKLGEPLSLERIIAIIREAKQIGILNIELNGGEVLLHPHYKEIVREVLQNGYSPFISTKVPISKKVIDNLREIGLEELQISLDSTNPKVLTEMLKVNGNYFDLMKESFQNLEKAGIKVIVHTIVTSLNSDIFELEKLVSFVSTFSNVRMMRFTGAGYSLYKTAENYEDIKPSDKFMNSVNSFVDSVRTKYPKILFTSSGSVTKHRYRNESSFNERAVCSGNLSSIVLLPDGRVTICEELYDDPRFIIGDLSWQSILDVWNSEKALSLFYRSKETFSKDSVCSSCEEFDKCRYHKGVCWKEIFMAYGTDKLDYPDPKCPKAPELKNRIYHE